MQTAILYMVQGAIFIAAFYLAWKVFCFLQENDKRGNKW